MRRLFDIAVPRNVAADVNEMEGAHTYNVDDLKEVVDQNKEARLAAAEEAKGLLEEERLSFEAWRDSLETVPTIKRLRSKAEAIRISEVEKALKFMGADVTKKQRKVLEELSRGITNKLLHGPMQALRSDGTNAQGVAETLVNMHALERMFDLQVRDAAALPCLVRAAGLRVHGLRSLHATQPRRLSDVSSRPALTSLSQNEREIQREVGIDD